MPHSLPEGPGQVPFPPTPLPACGGQVNPLTPLWDQAQVELPPASPTPHPHSQMVAAVLALGAGSEPPSGLQSAQALPCPLGKKVEHYWHSAST